MSNLINSIGLIFDLIGVILLYFFGLPNKIDPEGNIPLLAEQVD